MKQVFTFPGTAVLFSQEGEQALLSKDLARTASTVQVALGEKVRMDNGWNGFDLPLYILFLVWQQTEPH